MVATHYDVANAAAIRFQSFERELRRLGCHVDLLRLPLARTLLAPRSSFVMKLLFEVVAGVLGGARVILISRRRLVFVSTPPFFAMAIVLAVLRTKGQPYVVDIRDLFPEVLSASGVLSEASPGYALLRRLRRFTLSSAIQATTVNERLRDRILCDQSNTAVVANGYEPELWSRPAPKRPVFSVVMHGNLGRLYDIRGLVELASKLSRLNGRCEVHVVGDGVQADLVRQYKGGNLVYHGQLSYETTSEVVRSCHIGACLMIDNQATRESFPVKVYEFIGAGLPTIISPPGVGGAVLEEHQAGWQFSAGDTDAVIGKIQELRNNPESYEHAAANATGLASRYTRAAQVTHFLTRDFVFRSWFKGVQ